MFELFKLDSLNVIGWTLSEILSHHFETDESIFKTVTRMLYFSIFH